MNIPPRIHPYIHSNSFNKHQLLARKLYQSQKNKKIPDRSIEKWILSSEIPQSHITQSNSLKDEILRW